MTDTRRDAIWVASEPATLDLAHYGATVHYSDDLSEALHGDVAATYVATVLRAAGAAEYEAAVVRQLTAQDELGLDEAATVIAAMREHRPETFACGLLTLTPGLSSSTLAPFVACETRVNAWQWAPREARQHAYHVLDAVTCSDYDTAYYAVLTDPGKFGLDGNSAARAVAELNRFWDQN